MKNMSTFFYAYSDVKNKQNDELFDIDPVFSQNAGTKEFKEVFDYLQKTEFVPDNEVVNKILKFSENLK